MLNLAYLSNDGTLEMKCCQPSCDDNGRQVRDGSDRRKKCKSMAEAQKQLLVDFFLKCFISKHNELHPERTYVRLLWVV